MFHFRVQASLVVREENAIWYKVGRPKCLLKDAEASHKCEMLESGGLHPPTPAIRGGGRGELPSGGPCGRPVNCQYIWSGGLRTHNSRPSGDSAGSQALRGATEHQNLISATSLVFTTETCILWYVSLGSQHVILFPNYAKSVTTRNFICVMRNSISGIRKSV